MAFQDDSSIMVIAQKIGLVLCVNNMSEAVCIYFAFMPLGKAWIHLFFSQLCLEY